MKKIILIVSLFLCNLLVKSEDIKILEIANDELQRTMKELKTQPIPPYFVSFRITDKKTYNATSSFGNLKTSQDDKNRILDIDLRVGDYSFDNSHIIRGNPFNFNLSGGSVSLPLDDNSSSIKNAIWFATDKRYKAAIEKYEKATTNRAVKVMAEDTSADFSKEKPVEYYGEKQTITVDLKKFEDLTKRLSSKFSKIGWIYEGNVIFQANVQQVSYVSSEGSKLNWYETSCRIFVTASTKADDGMTLPLYESYFSYTPEGLPTEETIAQDIDRMIDLLSKLKVAPLATTFSGPAILSGEASGVFFHEIFGHRVEGHREKDPNSSQTFKNLINKKILPDFMNVVFDPTIKNINNTEVSGFYIFDTEGIKSQKVISVENGIFKNFLMSRSPIDGFSNSNGHGRAQAGYNPVSRQSNLIVESSKKITFEEMKKQLVDEAKKQNKDFGLFFDKVSGGFTFTDRTIPNAFNVTPLVVYKIYVDGRADELVRGVDLIGTPLTTFSNIIAASDNIGIFNGVCGAESGGVPVSASSPALLVSLIEVQKKQKSQAKPPLLPSPSMNP